MGRYRLHVRGEIDPAKQYLVQLENPMKVPPGIRGESGPLKES